MSTVPSNKSGVGNTATWLSLQLFEINPIKDPTILPKPQDNTTLVEARWSSQEATKYIGPPFHLSHLLSRRCWWRHISSYGIQSHIVLGPRLGFLTLQVRIYNRGVSNCCWSSRLANFGIYCNWRSLQRLNFLYSIKTCSPMHFPIETIYIYIYGSSNFLTHCMPSSSHNPMTTILQAQQLGHWRYHPTMNKREIEKNKNKNIKTEHAFNSMSWTIKEIWASGIRRK